MSDKWILKTVTLISANSSASVEFMYALTLCEFVEFVDEMINSIVESRGGQNG